MANRYAKNNAKAANDPRWLKLVKKPIHTTSKGEKRFVGEERRSRIEIDGTRIELPSPATRESCVDCLVDVKLPENPSVKDVIEARERSRFRNSWLMLCFITMAFVLIIVLIFGRTIRAFFESPPIANN